MPASLTDMFDSPHCGVCESAGAAARAYLKGVLDDGVNDPVVRSRWRRSGGLCFEHWRVWRSLDTPALPSALMTRDLLASALENGVASPEACPACEIAAAAEKRLLRSLERVRLAQVRERLEPAPGFLCLHHLKSLRNPALAEFFTARLRSFLGELEEFIRHNDHRHSHEPMGAERDSWLRAIRALGGRV